MRKSVDTLFLILLLIGPSIILTCVRQPTDENSKITQTQEIDETEENTVLLYADIADMPRP